MLLEPNPNDPFITLMSFRYKPRTVSISILTFESSRVESSSSQGEFDSPRLVANPNPEDFVRASGFMKLTQQYKTIFCRRMS